MGSPAGRKARWGEEGAPQRGGLPEAKHRVSPTQAEVAPDEAIQKCHPGGSRTDYAFAKGSTPPKATTNPAPAACGVNYAFAKAHTHYIQP